MDFYFLCLQLKGVDVYGRAVLAAITVSSKYGEGSNYSIVISLLSDIIAFILQLLLLHVRVYCV